MQRALSCENLDEFTAAQQALLERRDALEVQNHALREQLLRSDTALWLSFSRTLEQGRLAAAILGDGDVKHLRAVAEVLCAEQPSALLFAVRQSGQLSLLFMRSKSKTGPSLGAVEGPVRPSGRARRRQSSCWHRAWCQAVKKVSAPLKRYLSPLPVNTTFRLEHKAAAP